MSMNAVTTRTASSAGSSTTSPAVTAKNQLGKNEFLKLLTAQLANQDPLSPVDNQAFIAQLAQFSQLESLQNVSSQLDTLALSAASSNQLQSASLVGKQVLFDTDGVDVTAGTKPSLQVNLDDRATVVATIQDASGRTVRSLALGARDAGTFDLGWDGRDGSGAQVPSGRYTVTLTAKGADGASVGVRGRAQGLVQGVAFESGVARLMVGSADVKMSDVVQVKQS